MNRRTFLASCGGAMAAGVAGVYMRAATASGRSPESSEPSPRPFPLWPRSLAAAEVSAKGVVLAWREPYHHEDVAAYIIYRNFERMAEVAPHYRTYTDDDVKPGHTYTYTVRARNAAGRESVASGQAR